MSIKCYTCEAQTEIEKSFYKVRPPFRRAKDFFCPQCRAKRQRRSHQFQLLICAILGLVCVVMAVFGSEDSVVSMIGWCVLNLTLVGMFTLLQILPHEVGHALMARLLGWRVFTIVLGRGKNLCRFRCGRIIVEINTIPIAGYTWVASRSESCFRLKWFLIILAGPLTNAILLTSGLLLTTASLFFAQFPGTKLFPWMAFLGSCVLSLLSLIPARETVVSGIGVITVDSDGLALLRTFFLSRTVIHQRQSLYFFMEGFDSFQQHDYQAAKQWHERGLELYPEDIPNRYHLALALSRLKESHAARVQWLLLLKREDLSPEVRPTIANNLAWINLVIGDKELLAEADRLSQEAIRDQPRYPFIQGTRGSVLIELGETDQGLALVRQAFYANEDPRLKALNACYLALGECQRGNRAESQRQRDLAQKLDAECMLLDKVDQALAANQ